MPVFILPYRKLFHHIFYKNCFKWFQLELERHTGCLRSKPKFHLSFRARRKFIKWDFSIRIIYVKNLANIDLPPHGHLYQEQKQPCFLVSRQPFHYITVSKHFSFAVNQTLSSHHILFQAWKMFQNNLNKSKKCSSPTSCSEKEKAPCSFIEPSIDLIQLHASDKKESDFS